MRVQCRLPREDRNVPADRRIPDGRGAAVRLAYDGPVVGQVVDWEDQGDGTALADLEFDLPPWFAATFDADQLTYGLEAIVGGTPREDGLWESIREIRGVAVLPPEALDGNGRSTTRRVRPVDEA